jgi:2-keto-4-pentenoate hydratase/2-oxohepta-3-ene-1,7-dioic acid hydratase in catechol pathway
MRYATFSTTDDPRPRLGVVHDGHVVDVQTLRAANDRPLPASLLELIQSGPAEWSAVAAHIRRRLTSPKARACASDAIRWHAPIPRPLKNVFCVGRNFVSHAEEAARARGEELKLPERPMFFTKAPTTVSGPFDDVPWDRTATQQVDWEAELGVIIGNGGTNIDRDRALSHVFGYTVVNDVTARDLQRSHGQFFKGKSLDGFCPIGPVVVTADAFGDPHEKELSLRVNGVEKQRGSTRNMIFPVDALIASLSSGLTLEPGDILAAGTPEGVGFARTPPEFLQHGDVMETEVEGIGVMRNRIVARGA